MDWQHISTAPKDGSKIIILAVNGVVFQSRWQGSYWDKGSSYSKWYEFDKELKHPYWISLPNFNINTEKPLN